MNPDARKSSSFIGTVTPWSPRKGTFSPSTQQVQPLLASTIAGAWITAGLLAPPRRVLPHDWTSSGKYGDLMQKFGKEGGHTCCSFGDSGVCLTGAPVLLATSVTGKEDSKSDIWRDSVLRYAGYANEIGESFRFIAPRLVVPSYAVSIAYVCGDTADKAYKELSEGRGKIAAVKMGVDVLLWQLLASVAVPGLTIHLVVKAMKTVMANESATRVIPQVARKWVPTAVGLGIIPLIIHPIDDAVTLAMDSTVRRWM